MPMHHIAIPAAGDRPLARYTIGTINGVETAFADHEIRTLSAIIDRRAANLPTAKQAA